jgi:hypothetical protein
MAKNYLFEMSRTNNLRHYDVPNNVVKSGIVNNETVNSGTVGKGTVCKGTVGKGTVNRMNSELIVGSDVKPFSSYIFSEKQKKKVSFFPYTKVYEIPNREQLNEMQLIPVMWWNQQDYAMFRMQSTNEIHMVHRLYPRLHVNAIRKLLYQPDIWPKPSAT